MSQSNPFSFQSVEESPPPNDSALLEELARLLAQTKTWVRFLSVLGFLASLSALAFVSLGFIVGGAAPGPAELLTVLPMCLLVYFIPSLLLWKYASRIADFLRASDPESFSASLAAQRSFWRYVGILMLIVIVIYVFAIVAAIVVVALG